MRQNSDKIRMLSVRVSQEEYDFLKNDYRLKGARSVSDYARLVLSCFLETEMAEAVAPMEVKLAHLAKKIEDIRRELRMLQGRG